jgi:hypothetical protein
MKIPEVARERLAFAVHEQLLGINAEGQLNLFGDRASQRFSSQQSFGGVECNTVAKLAGAK